MNNPSDRQKTILCLASYEKGHEFLRQCRRNGWRVLLLTSHSLKQKASWPLESVDEVFYVPDVEKEWRMEDVINGVSFLARSEKIDRIVALDDFDVEKAAALREHLRIPGMGDTTARFFRDKLAMRTQALASGIHVPPFIHILNHDAIRQFLNAIPPPYVIKPRFQAGAIGIRKVESSNQVWEALHELGDKQSFHVLEQFIRGTVYHIDSLVAEGAIALSIPHRYGLPPLEVAHEGRVFSSITLSPTSEDRPMIDMLNQKVLKSMRLLNGVSHTEFIKGESDGKFYFLETSARVGGAHIVELIEAETGLNLWAEWAHIETRDQGHPYVLPRNEERFGAILICLARQEWPDLGSFDAPEVFWRLRKKHHAGLILCSPELERTEELLQRYAHRFEQEFLTTQPVPERPTD
jgi:biotin carboxylase